MKKFKISAMLLFAAMLMFSACGGGGGGGSDDPKDPDNPGDNPGDDPKNPGDPGDPTATLEINGNTYTYTLPGGTVFKAMLTPDIATTNTFPTGADDSVPAYVPVRFIMGETQVTYELWYEVHKWATTDAGGKKRADGGVLYNFANAGAKGGYTSETPPILTDQHPVTMVNWCLASNNLNILKIN